MEDFEGFKAYAVYSYFTVADVSDGFRLRVGDYSGNAGKKLSVAEILK